MSCASLPVILTPDQNLNKHELFTFGMPITRNIYLQYKSKEKAILCNNVIFETYSLLNIFSKIINF